MSQPSKVLLETTMGDIKIELYWKHAPKTCKNFAELANSGYYTGCIFHRIIKVSCVVDIPGHRRRYNNGASEEDFMIQGGDPTGTGRGGSSIYGECFEDEIHPDLRHTGAGIISMANSGPNTNGSQFFITLAPTSWLNDKHTIFGRVSEGITVVKKMGMVETSANDKPTDEIMILQAYTQD